MRVGWSKTWQILSAICLGEKKSTNKPFSPSWITSATGGVSEPITKQPVDMDSIIDQDNTNGRVKYTWAEDA